MDNVIKDLETFSTKDLNILYNYYNIDPYNSKKLHSLAHLLFKKGFLKNIFDAITHNNIQEVKKFLNKPGFNIDALDKHGYTPLITAIQEHHTDIAKLLIEHNASITLEVDSMSPLQEALNENQLDIVSLLLEKGAQVNKKNAIGDTALFYTSDPNAITLLLKYGADINMLNNKGDTVLFYKGSLESTKVLIENGINVNIQNNKKESALTRAIKDNDNDIIQYLIDNGANINNTGGVNPLELANDMNTEAIYMLLDAGAKINSNDLTNVIKIKVRDLRLLIKGIMSMLTSDEKDFYNTSKLGKSCEKIDYTLKGLDALEQCLKMIKDMINYKASSKGFEKAKKDFEKNKF